MRKWVTLSLLLFAFCTAAYFSWRWWSEATVIEGLDASENIAIRNAIATEGPTTASPSREWPYPRVLIVPKSVEASYAKKPDETVKLLLRIVKNGEPWESIHASACIHALLWGPEFGWMATHVDNKTWDDRIAEGRETRREFAYDGCARLIAKKEKGEIPQGER